MGRLLVPVILGLLLGGGIGWLQANYSYSRIEERFVFSKGAAVPDQTAAEVKVAPTVDQSQGNPLVEVVGGSQFDFGTMMHGDSMSHDFVFKNIGKGPLNLVLGSSTCKCTLGQLKDATLEPGEETAVTLTWTAKTILPEFSQAATIKTNDPAHTEVRLIVSGTVVNSLLFEPASIEFGDISTSEGSTRSLKVFSYLDQVEVGDVAWSDKSSEGKIKIEKVPFAIDAETYPKHIKAVRGYDISLTVLPGMRLGKFDAKMLFKSSLGEDKMDQLDVAVTGRVTGDAEIVGGPSFEVDKNVLNIGKVDPKEGASIRLQLVLQGQQRLAAQPEIVSVEPAESLQVSLGEPRETETKRFYPILFTVPKNAPKAYFPGLASKNFGKVVIRTSADGPELRIYVRLVIEE